MTDNVIDFMPHADAAKAVPLQVKVEVYERAIREWIAHTNVNEFVVLMAIIDRTTAWGRREAYFSTYALLEGDGTYAGLPISRASLFRALASLDKKGLIRRRHDRANTERVHYSVNINWKPGIMNPPEQLEQAKTKTNVRSHTEILQSRTEIDRSPSETVIPVPLTVSNNDNLERGLTPRSLANPGERLRQEMVVAQAASRSNRQVGAAMGGRVNHQSTVVAIEMAWRLAIIATFPGIPIPLWGGRERAQAKNAARKWQGSKIADFPTFIDWAARNWTAIMRTQFKWMTKNPPPPAPRWNFVFAMLGQFIDCYAEGRIRECLADPDRAEVDKIMARGATWEQAMTRHADTKATNALRGEMQQAALVADLKVHSAELTMEHARKLADVAGNAPIHPRSRLALRLKREAAEADAAARRPTTAACTPEEFTGVVMLPERNPFDAD